MPDNLKRRRPLDSRRINVNQAYEVVLWMRHFNVTESELRSAVAAVGDSAVAVEKWLQDKVLKKRLLDLARKRSQRYQ